MPSRSPNANRPVGAYGVATETCLWARWSSLAEPVNYDIAVLIMPENLTAHCTPT